MGEIGPRRTAVFIGQVYIYDANLISPRGKHAPFPIYDLRYACPMKTAIRLGAISPITG